MIDRNQNGIPDAHETCFLIVRLAVLIWSTTMLTASYFIETKIDQTYMATMMTASAASFGVKRNEKPKVPQGRTKLPHGFDK